jgi:hypothetical protein
MMSLIILAQTLAMLRLPYVLDHATPADGNCFFHAVIQQLRNDGNIQYSDHLKLRKDLVKFVENDPTLQENEVFNDGKKIYIEERKLQGEGFQQAWKRLITEMACDGIWAEDIFILCTAIFLKRDIYVTSKLQKVKQPWVIFYGASPTWVKPLTLVMIPNEHFQSIILRVDGTENFTICHGCGFKTKSSILIHLSRRPNCAKMYDMEKLKDKKKNRKNYYQRKVYNDKKMAGIMDVVPKPEKIKLGDLSGEIERKRQFKNSIKYGPVFDCLSCERNLFLDSIKEISLNEARKVFEFLYSHTEEESAFLEEERKYYLCPNCHGYIKKGKVPPIAHVNGLFTEDIPDNLKLNELGATLIARNIIFLKLFKLPRSRWNALKDKIVNVPIENDDVQKTLNCVTQLPRCIGESGIIPVKLKRKMCYKNTVLSSYVDPDLMVQAVQFLRDRGHPGYLEININRDAVQDYTEVEDTLSDDGEDMDISDSDGSEIEEDEHVEQPTMYINNYPETRVGNELPGQDNALNIAPGEGKIPSNLMREDCWDVNAFPLLFPSGRFGINFERESKLSAQKYICQRVLNKNMKFVSYPPWLFSALYYIERQQLEQQINVNCRKGMLKDSQMFQVQDGFDVFHKVSGTPKYWQQKRYEMIARLEQLGPFQFFFTLSCADKRWMETLISIFQLQGQRIKWKSENPEQVTVNDIPIAEYLKTVNLHDTIRNNILILTRCFDKRVHAFLKYIVKGKDSPMNVEFFNYRVEFQLRGAGHIHGVIWVNHDKLATKFPLLKEAFAKLKFGQKLSTEMEDCLTSFTDSFVTCSLENDVAEIVSEVQHHSHTPSCKKYGNKCRFNFPKYPSDRTIICYKLNKEEFQCEQEYSARKREIKDILTHVQNYIEEMEEKDLGNYSLQDILTKCDITEDAYYNALKYHNNGTTVVLKRKVNEVYINNYNEEWIGAWNGNMDLQVCLDYFAILTYITDYYSKDDTGTMGILRQAARQCRNESLNTQMKCLAQAFLSHRQIGESEAIYRILPNMHLTESNIKCIFLANGFPQNRSRFLVKITESNSNITCDPADIIRIEGREGEYVAKTDVHTKYSKRPSNMENMCLAEFAMFYENFKLKKHQDVVEDDSSDTPVYCKIDDAKKTMMKRREKPMILRYHHLKLDTHLHEYLYSELLFFKSWRDENSLFHDNASKCTELYNAFSTQIQKMKEKLFPYKNNIEAARMMMQDNEYARTDVGDVMDTQNEMENLEDAMEDIYRDEDFGHLDPEFVEVNPETNLPEKSKYKRIDISNVEQMLTSARSLSFDQRLVFDRAIGFCKGLLKNRSNHNYVCEPQLLMVHGGAGSGKSKLINDISQ